MSLVLDTVALGAIKLDLADRELADMDTYVAAKSSVLQEVLQASGRFTPIELETIAALNTAPRSS